MPDNFNVLDTPTTGGGTPASTVTDETTFGVATAVGTGTDYARVDHTHGSPTNPVTAHEAAADPHTGYVQESAMSAFGRGGTLLNPTAGQTVLVWRATDACTVTNVRAKCKGGTSITFNARRNGASNHLASAATASAGDATTDLTDGGAVQNTAYVVGDRLEIMVVTISGSPTEAAIQVDFNRTLP